MKSEHRTSELVKGEMKIPSEENYFQQLIDSLPVAIYTCDSKGFINQFNSAAADLWGNKPILGKAMWCGSWKIYNPDGTRLALNDCPMAIAINEGRCINNREIVVERPDGTRVTVLPHPKPIFNENGDVVGAVNMLMDITETKRREKNLLENQDRLRLATEGTKLATWDLNLRTREIHYSKRLGTIFGFSEDESLTHQDLLNSIHPRDYENVFSTSFKKALEAGNYFYEARIIHPDKSIHWIRTHGKVFYDHQNRPARMLGTTIDISEQKIAEEKIAMLAEIVHSSNDAIISKTLDGIITSWNDSAEKIFGYSADEIVGQSIIKLIPKARINEELRILNLLKKGERVNHFQTQRITKDNRIVDLSLTISPIKDKKGNIIGASKIARDITEQIKDEQLIRINEQKFRLLADALSQLIMTIDDKANVCYVNQSFIGYTGKKSEELINESWLKYVHPNDLERTTSMWEASLCNGNEFLGEQRLLRYDGKYEWHLTRIIPQQDQDGKIQMWVGTSTNIHENKIFTEELEKQVQQRTDELKLLNDDLQKSNNELAEFAFVASHDLQEPLRKIQTFANRIVQKEESNLSVNGKDYLKRMQNSTLRMQALIEDLLKYSRTSTAEKIFEPVDLNNLLNEVKAELDQRISEKHAKVNVAKMCVLNIIRFQFLQLFMNLISNSLKFSKPGINPEINISSILINGKEIRDKRADFNHTYCNIIVEDNGIGFPSEYSEKIFELFYRLHGKSEFSGTGIGLSICKKIVENHHGFITAKSNPASGSTFNIYIPVELDVA